MTAAERAIAVAVARREISKEDAKITSASASVSTGVVTDSNTGAECLSGRLLHIKPIGSFAHITVSPPGLAAGSHRTVDTTVRAVALTADADTGRTCLVAVQTGKVQPKLGATVLNIHAP
jgi:hypothetical protein